MKMKLDPMQARSPRFSHMYNQFIQAWNTIFFLCAAAGGGYLLARTEHLLLGAALLVVGIGGVVFCGRQLQKLITAGQTSADVKEKH